MSYLLTDADVVLLVGGSASRRDDVATVLDEGAIRGVVDVRDSAAVPEALSDRDDVGCVVVLDGSGVEEVVSAARVAGNGGRVPVLAAVEHDPSVAATVAAREGCRYVPADAGDAALRRAVEDALAAYDRRRWEAADSDFLGTLLEGSDISMFAKDDRGRYLRTSQLLDDLGEEDIVGRTDREVLGSVDPRSAEATYRDDLEVVETGEPIHGKRERFGTDHWSETTKLPWRVDGEVQGLVGFALDVTREVEFERQLAEQNRRFEQFAGYVSHDLRTPLQIAFGALDRARAGDEEALEKVEEAHERIEEIIDDLRRLTEEDTGPESSEFFDESDSTTESTRLGPLVEKIWRVTAPNEATLELDVPDGTVVVTESEVLRPLVENLLKNAVDHGGRDVAVRVGLVGDRSFFVEDDGPGIPPEDRKRVLQQGYTTAESGSGTGLAIVNQTVLQQNWSLSIETSQFPGAEATDQYGDTPGHETGGDPADPEWTRGTRVVVSECPVVVPVETHTGEALSLSDAGDVGPVAVEGSAAYDAGEDRWTVRGGGQDVWADTNEFHYVWTETDGPLRIQARVETLADVHEYSKAGLMVRDDRDEDATFAFVGQTSAHGSEVIHREVPGQPAESHQFEEPSGAYDWYRLERVGETVTLSVSPDGAEFHPVDQRSIELADPVVVGLAVCSHESGERCEATFADVEAVELDAQ